jgi:OmpA-OmpF porin, OOP family
MRRVVVDLFFSTRIVPDIDLASPRDQETLKRLAQTATGLTGYIVEVTGFADSTGSAAMNTKLSEDRAKAVITFLRQQGNVPIRHIVAPGAMGEYGAKAPNETKAGRAENCRVEVKVLVNKGIAR